MNRAPITVVLSLGLAVSLTSHAQAPSPAPQPAADSQANAPSHAATGSAQQAHTRGADAAETTPSAGQAASGAAVKPLNPKAAEAAELAEAGNPSPVGSPTTPTPAAPGAQRPVGPANKDTLELGTTEISGNRELPKVLYVVPWHRPEPGDQVGRPPNSLVEEALTPIDRDVFQRQNRYYSALQSNTAPAKSQPGPAGAAAARAKPQDER